jgi:hypothetical protein
MATTFREMVEEIEATTYDYPHERVAAYEKLRGLVDQTFDAYQRRCAAVDVADAALRDEVNGHPSRWKLENALNSMRVQIDARISALTKSGRVVRQFVARGPTTLASISYDLGVDLAGLISLNPKLLYSPVVPKGAVVRYHPNT